MRERPILFSAPMVRAILDGTKTQTRRVVKGVPADLIFTGAMMKSEGWVDFGGRDEHKRIHCPYGQPGDRLWVREAWADLTAAHGQRWERHNPKTGLYERGVHPFAWYRADGDQPDTGSGTAPRERWRPSIHMPRWASRITLEVTGVRVERLQAISEADAIAEGIHRIRIGDGYDDKYSATPHSWADAVERHPDVQDTARAAYRELWESINGLGSWLVNPWVWVVEFKRIVA